jgi:hypothetical protein
MKRFLLIGVAWGLGLPLAQAADSTSSPRTDEIFSTAVRPADFSAAGLGKLTPDELARLDALVRDFKSGALLAAKREAATAEAARVAAEEKAAKAEVAKSAAEAKSRAATERAEAVSAAPADSGVKKIAGGIVAKAKVLLAPGTEVEYASTDSRIAGDFTGWSGKAIFTLENGQRWLVVNGGEYSTPPIPSPKVKIVPASLGGFWMTIEGVSQRVRVSPLGGGK